MTRVMFAALCASLAACATAPAATTPTGSTENLTGTTWRLAISEGRIDGRTIEFKRGPTSFQAVLTKVGRQLETKVGAHEGLVVMELVPDHPGTFAGSTRLPGQDEANVFCSVSRDGQEMKCNDENTPWKRVSP